MTSAGPGVSDEPPAPVPLVLVRCGDWPGHRPKAAKLAGDGRVTKEKGRSYPLGCGPFMCSSTRIFGRRDSHVHVLERRAVESRVRGAPSKQKDVRADSDQATYKPKETQGGTV